ncbi:MAG: elongation factor G [Betaproteobacteria bacterium RIFCSPLOWO2_02_FULL_62_17]|nr:MAG: elongation factor G [Betaproteobacteria bacterium RIFCSPLOWO2_02_FULL_62_17]
MSKVSIKNIRTLALVGQAGSGKTSLAEALLAAAGAIPAAGSVERGTTVCDCLPLEKQLRHSLKLAVASFESQDTRIHLLDTPGYPDFVGHSLPALCAVETAAIVINAQNGIELMTQRMMHWAERMGLDRIIVVNRIDAEHADLPALLDRIRETFGKECLPINLPAGGATRVSDCFFAPGGESDFSSVAKAHGELVDQVVEIDEKLMALYLEQGEIAPEQLHEPFERALREGHLIPVVFTSALTGAGVAELLQVIVRLLPNPTEGNPPRYVSSGDASTMLEAIPDPGRHVLAHVFKVEIDPFIGRVGVFRVHQGRVTPNMQLYAGDARKAFKPGHLWMLRGKQQLAIDEALPGDICAVSKVEELRFDQVLHDAPEDAHIHAQPFEFPASVFGLTLLPKKHGDEQKLSDVLHRFVAEDPCFHVERDAQANETVIRGLGELHLKTLLDRMAAQHKIEVDTRPPSIPFRETIAAKAQGHSRHKKQTGGAGQFGEVFLRVEPLPRGSGFEFADEVRGGVIPSAFIPAVEKGVRGVLESGFLAGFPIQDLRVIVYDGKSHPVDSKEVAFVSAGRKAFLDALGRARPVILEPVVNLEVVVPDQHIGDVAGDLGARRAHLRGTELVRPGVSRIAAQVPMPELENFPARLKSLTSGEGAYTLEFSHYEPAPAPLQQRLAAAYKPQEEVE